MDIPGTTENIIAYLSGHLTDKQVEAFEQWRDASKHNADLVTEIETVWENALHYESPYFDSALAIDKMPFKNQQVLVDKVKSISPGRPIFRWAAAAAVILAIGSWAVYQSTKPVFTEADGRYTELLNLEDGTEVFFDNSGVILFPKSFSLTERSVILDGRAYFDVASESSRKFVIQTDYASVLVLGTEFDVTEDDDTQTVEVFVTEGKVRLQPTGSDVYIDVAAGESAIYDHKSGKLQRTAKADMNHVAWHTKRLRFDRTSIPKVIHDIEAAYNVSIDYQNSGITECSFSSLYDNVEVTKILEDMAVVFSFHIISPREGHYMLNGGNCNPTEGQ